LVQLAKATEGLTGSEIEAVFTEALHDAFDGDAERGRMAGCGESNAGGLAAAFCHGRNRQFEAWQI
jgi:hypothetical protein